MRLRGTLIAVAFVGILGCSSEDRGLPAFKEAKQKAAERHQPMLVEFTTDKCPECARAVQISTIDADVRAALERVSFVRIDVKSEEGQLLATRYKIGIRLPAYILADAEGREITRWTSVANATAFARQLSRATSDLTTIETRLERMNSAPSLDDALVLGAHFMSTQELPLAAEYYHKADLLNADKKKNLKFEVFEAMANAVWFGQAQFDEAEKAADDVISGGYRPMIDPVRVAHVIGDLARKTGHTDRIAKYMRIAYEKVGEPTDDNTRKIRAGILADLQLYGDHDTLQAIETKRGSFGPAFRRTPLDEVDFADWCASRGVNLDQAEATMNRFLQESPPQGRSVAVLQFALAKIARARGDLTAAMAYAGQAVDSDPQNPIMVNYLKQLQEDNRP